MGAKSLEASRPCSTHAQALELLVGRMITDLEFDNDTGCVRVRMDNGSFELHGDGLQFVYFPSAYADLH